MITHKFISSIPDEESEDIVKPSAWNDDHDFDMDGITINHDELEHLDYASAGHTGFQSALGFTAYDWTNTNQNLFTSGLITGGGLSTIGAEKLSDPDFDTPAAWDVSAGGWTITGGQAVHAEAPTNLIEAVPTTIEADVVYKVEYFDTTGLSDVTVSLGGLQKAGGAGGAGIRTLYFKTINTNSLVIAAVGDVTLNYFSLKKVGNVIVGDLVIGGELSVASLTVNEQFITGLDGITDLSVADGGDAPDVLTIVGGDGGYGSDTTGNGGGLSIITGSSPEYPSGQGNGGNFTLLTGSGDAAGEIDLDTGMNQGGGVSPRGMVKLGKSGGNTVIGGKLRVGGVTHPAAVLEIAAGGTTIPPLKINIGTLTTSIVAGAIEYCDVTNRLFFSSSSGTRRALVEGTGVSGRIPIWTSSGAALSSDPGFLYNYTNQRVGSAGGFEVQDIKVVGQQQTHIIDADGTLADITTKFNNLLLKLETHGLLASS